jgi:oleate hydratase
MVNSVSKSITYGHRCEANISWRFFLQPWHSAVEFRRLLRKFLPEMHHHCAIKTLQKTEYTLYESLLVPITKYLKDEGVDFRFGMLVTDISMYPASEPTTVSDIVTLQNGDEAHIEVEPHDIVIVTLGSMTTGQQTGSNNSPPPTSLTPQIEEPQDKNWSLWIKLAEKSSIFGDPASFISRTTESSIETFTSTFRDSDFEDRFQKLAGIYPECGATLRLVGSPWGLCVSVPHQPLFQEQPCNVTVIWGYGLRPDKKGKFIEKPMQQCTGEEVLLELLSHLKFPTEKLLTSTTTIPCLMPLGTSMLLNRKYSNRPEVVPRGMKNMACIGQYVEISDDTTLSVEYSVRGAQKATCDLMGLSQQPPKIRTNILLEVLDLLV